MAEKIEDFVARAIGDPGSVLDRYTGETVARWSTRAVMTMFEAVGTGSELHDYEIGSPATRMLMENAQMRAYQGVLEQDVKMWARRAGAAEGGQKAAAEALEQVELLENLLVLATGQVELPLWLMERIVEAIPRVKPGVAA